MTFGNAIKMFRKGQRMTQSQVAQLADISVSYLSLIERDKRDPSMSMIGKLSKAVGAPVIMVAFLMDSNRLSEIDPVLGQKTTDCALGYLKAKTLQREGQIMKTTRADGAENNAKYKIQFRVYGGAFYDYKEHAPNEFSLSEAENKLEYLRKYLSSQAEYRAVMYDNPERLND